MAIHSGTKIAVAILVGCLIIGGVLFMSLGKTSTFQFNMPSGDSGDGGDTSVSASCYLPSAPRCA